MATTLNFKNLERSIELSEFYAEIEASIQGTILYSDNLLDKINIIQQSYDLTDFQLNAVNKLFEQFKKIEDDIDPDRLKFSVGATPDNEILLYRRTVKGLTNLIIDEDDYITYSFIHKKEGDILNPYSLSKGNLDFEEIALCFLSK